MEDGRDGRPSTQGLLKSTSFLLHAVVVLHGVNVSNRSISRATAAFSFARINDGPDYFHVVGTVEERLHHSAVNFLEADLN
jgi:hypothetical protein